MSKATIEDFKGHKILCLVDAEDGKFGRRVSFGVGKATLILENIDEIKKFVDANKGVDDHE
jgi:hypothetical protein